MAQTILVVDDDPAVLRAYGRLLGRLGCRVLLAADGREACHDPEALRQVDLLILDERMPGTSGLELLEGLNARRATAGRGPVVILISALPSDALRRRAAGLGVAEVIEKPVDPARLLRTIRRVLDGVFRADIY
jgi:CheY-like chemotaxis protein